MTDDPALNRRLEDCRQYGALMGQATDADGISVDVYWDPESGAVTMLPEDRYSVVH